MTVLERLDADMKEALKARDQVRLRTIRMLRSALKNAEIDKRAPLGEDEVLQVLSRELKLREESLAEFRRAGREEQAAELEQEIRVVRSYLPEPLSEEQVRQLAREAIAAVGAAGSQDMGRVMGALMPRVRGRADGGVVSRIVREELQARAGG